MRDWLYNIVTLETIIQLAVIYVVLLFLFLIIWVAQDIHYRANSIWYKLLCISILIIFTPFIGIFLYLLIRPRKSIYDREKSEIEYNLGILQEIVQERITEEEKGELKCPECFVEIQEEYVVCPSCQYVLKHHCPKCDKEVREGWKICPYCQAKLKKNKKKEKTE